MGAAARPGRWAGSGAFYSLDKVVHFILLGLLWGSAWLHMALVGHRRAVATADVHATAIPEPQPSPDMA